MRYITIFTFFMACLIIFACSPKITATADNVTSYPETALAWKLSAQAYTFKKFTFAEAVSKVDSCKLRYIEGYPAQLLGGGLQGALDFKMDAEQRSRVLNILKAKNVKLIAYGVVRPANDTEWRQLFTFAKNMGIQTLVTEPQKQYLDLISALCDEFKIGVVIHNHAKPAPYWHPDSVLAVVKGRSKLFGACADVGHWVRSGLNPVACLKKLDGRVMHLHMKDLNKKNAMDAHDVHWGTGLTDIPGVIAELKRQQFKGVISAEFEYNWLSNSADVAASIAWFRKNLNQ